MSAQYIRKSPATFDNLIQELIVEIQTEVIPRLRPLNNTRELIDVLNTLALEIAQQSNKHAVRGWRKAQTAPPRETVEP